jgi:hypothetical protein
MKCPQNIHTVERIARIVLGVGLISMAFIGPQSKWFFLGIIPLLTGIVGYCPPDQLLGINTKGKSSSCDKKPS